MTQRTHLGNTIDAVDPNKELYDKNIKELLADIQILARIIKYTVDEVRELSSEVLFGKLRSPMIFDKMCGIIVQLRIKQNVEESKHHLIAMLEDLLCNEEQEKKKQRLTQKYGMKMTFELERRLEDMCNLSDLVEERGRQHEIFTSVQEGDYSPERGAEKLNISIDEFQKRMLEAGYGN